MTDLEQIVDGVEPVEVEAEVVEAAPEQEEAPEVEEIAEALEPEVKPEAQVPLAALLEVRKELQEIKSLATPKAAPAPTPDVFDDPAGYQKHMQELVSQSQTAQKLEMSRFMAEREFGADNVKAMFDHFNQHPEQSAQLMEAPSPFHAGMDLYNQQRVATEIGNDPAAYEARIRAEERATVQAELVAKQAKEAAESKAPSMAHVTGTGGGPKTTWTGPTQLGTVLPE